MRRCCGPAGSHLGSLAGRDLAARCAEGRLDAKGRAVSRAVRKRALTAQVSSRWAGAITRASEDQWQPRRTEPARRASQPAGEGPEDRGPARRPRGREVRPGARVRDPGRAARQSLRLKSLKARLARADRQLEAGTVSVVRGGKALLRKRANLAAAGLTEAQWRARVGIGPAVPDRRRGEGQGAGERDDPLAPGRGLAGDQAARPAGAPGEPAARPLPAVVPGRVHLPGR